AISRRPFSGANDMPADSTNRAIFWRIVRRMLVANRARLGVLLLALVAAATITAALLNLQIDARRRLTTEFRALGANILVSPPAGPELSNRTLDQSLLQKIPSSLDGQHVAVLSVLPVAVEALASDPNNPVQVVASGELGDGSAEILEHEPKSEVVVVSTSIDKPSCWAGVHVAERLHVK